MERIFPRDVFTKRQRVERALSFLPVDRVPIHEQLSNSPCVAAYFTGRDIEGFDYTLADIGVAVQKSLDCTFPLCAPVGMGIETTPDGFVYKLDNWTKWHLSRPFSDEDGAARWLKGRIAQLEQAHAGFDAARERRQYRAYMQAQQALVGETVIMDFSITTGFCDVYDKMGLELFSYFLVEYEPLLEEYMRLSGSLAVKKAQAVGDPDLTPVVLIAEDFCTMGGTIFSPRLLRLYHYPWVKALTEAWHSWGIKVIYHTDGNFRPAIDDLCACGVDGFYCLERNCAMHIEELVAAYPQKVWMGGVDGVSTMELGDTERVCREVRQIIERTDAVRRGGVFIDSSSEINPPIPLENYLAMLETCDELRDRDFCLPAIQA